MCPPGVVPGHQEGVAGLGHVEQVAGGEDAVQQGGEELRLGRQPAPVLVSQ